MSAEIELQEHERLEDQNAAWSGEPVTLTVPPWGGNSYRGLASTVHFPADGVHPVRRQAALEVKAAERERAKLDEELAARGPQREQLVKAGHDAARTRGPKWVTAVHALKDHDVETEMITGLIPSADDHVREAWNKLSAVVFATADEQAAYCYPQGQKAAQEAVQLGQAYLAKLAELQEIEQQMVGTRIIATAPATTPAEHDANFARGQRIASIRALQEGVDKGTQGHQHDLVGLAFEYRALFTSPEPQPEVEVDPDPPAVQVRKENLAKIRGQRIVEIPWTP